MPLQGIEEHDPSPAPSPAFSPARAPAQPAAAPTPSAKANFRCAVSAMMTPGTTGGAFEPHPPRPWSHSRPTRPAPPAPRCAGGAGRLTGAGRAGRAQRWRGGSRRSRASSTTPSRRGPARPVLATINGSKGLGLRAPRPVLFRTASGPARAPAAAGRRGDARPPRQDEALLEPYVLTSMVPGPPLHPFLPTRPPTVPTRPPRHQVRCSHAYRWSISRRSQSLEGAGGGNSCSSSSSSGGAAAAAAAAPRGSASPTLRTSPCASFAFSHEASPAASPPAAATPEAGLSVADAPAAGLHPAYGRLLHRAAGRAVYLASARAFLAQARAPPCHPPPLPHTNRTSLVPPLVLSGHAPPSDRAPPRRARERRASRCARAHSGPAVAGAAPVRRGARAPDLRRPAAPCPGGRPGAGRRAAGHSGGGPERATARHRVLRPHLGL
jgi:hypothetical protein